MGVRNPIKSETPLAIITTPTAQISKVGLTRSARYTTPWITAVTPMAARSSSKPTPGNPLGNVENRRARSVSFVLACWVGAYQP
jgi:hypothetical protein